MKIISDKKKFKAAVPLFDVAQSLFFSYSTLQSDSELENILKNQMANDDINLFVNKDPRGIINEVILKNYPNELSVKANFINEVLMKAKNQVTVFELIVGESRADLCKVNGSSTAYEIKTDLDNLKRLPKQIDDYLKIFERVFVICSEKKVTEIEACLIPECGIFSYNISKTGKYKFKQYKKALDSNKIDPQKQLEMLRRKELISGYDISVNSNKNEMINQILSRYSPEKINLVFKNIIKLRYKNQWEFLKENQERIYEIDYQWFFKNKVNPELIYY